MKKYSVSLTEGQMEHIRQALDQMIQDVEYGGKTYREYVRLEGLISKAFREATQPLTGEALKDIRRTLVKDR
jgi:hypothetical protein